MANAHPPTPRLVGRAREVAALTDFVRKAAVDGSALLLTGEPGVGKSALLQAACEVAEAERMRVVRGAGVEYESDVSFSALHQLVVPLATWLPRLPDATRAILETTLGIGSAPIPDRLAVFDAALTLFRLAAAELPLLVVIDDMHWVDRASASVIGFVGRRLDDSRLGLLAAARPGAGGFFDRTGWRDVVVPPLEDAESLELLAHQFAHLPIRVHREIAHEAQGNPLALLEFASAGRGPTGTGGQVDGTVREVKALYNARIAVLPSATRSLMLLAALEGSGDLAVIAAASPTGAPDDLAPAELDHLVLVDDAAGHMTFRHPLIKSVMVDRSTFEERRRVHLALAEVFTDPERRGHHLAEAALCPDEDTAAAVEAGARSTLQRGDVVGAVTRLMRAADLSPDRTQRNRRLADAAFIGAFSTGRLEDASRLLRDVTRGDPTAAETLQATVTASYLLLTSEADVTTAHQLLTDAIRSALDRPEACGDDLTQAVYTLSSVCQFAGRADYWESLREIVARLPPSAITDAVVIAAAQGDPLVVPPATLEKLDRAITGLDDSMDVAHIVRTVIAAFNVDRLAGCRGALDRVVHDGREGGAVGSAVLALTMVAFDDYRSGRWDAAARAAHETKDLCADLGYRLYTWGPLYGLALVAANRGDRDACIAQCRAMLDWAEPRQFGWVANWARHALTEAALAHGDFETAYAHAVSITEPGSLGTHNPEAVWTGLDLVEAAHHTGRAAQARDHAAVLQQADLGRITPRFAFTTAAAAAMVAPDAEAPGLFERAVALPAVESWPFELARVRLAFGERLRRLRRTRDARGQLDAARAGFERLGAVPWAHRAATELRATGVSRGTATVTGADSLTPQETEVAELAASGLTNREIAARLYVSPRTVSAHLYRIFPKLGITSRAALRDALGDAARH
ncbi:AAA family ATPase [Aeromicrobium sp. 636]|uniref:AAA family ATPase n=1 Tax=Aeromicrobium senzhongii TaxID=2663859 RepID=A0A8I0ESE9_9ACTN|nr:MULTISPECIES: LuxR family transcriptional regulator [Aeromicrobium]MBC9225164.1 AAA family ATPase [Aeromicrobium senzhongii]MCQ3997274.1 AAA family ATPase [Aeromicrobium sp. 636]